MTSFGPEPVRPVKILGQVSALAPNWEARRGLSRLWFRDTFVYDESYSHAASKNNGDMNLIRRLSGRCHLIESGDLARACWVIDTDAIKRTIGTIRGYDGTG